jgi:hypothetical protein
LLTLPWGPTLPSIMSSLWTHCAVSFTDRVEAGEGQELEAAVGALEQVLRDRVTPGVIRTMWDTGSGHVTWSLPGWVRYFS